MFYESAVSIGLKAVEIVFKGILGNYVLKWKLEKISGSSSLMICPPTETPKISSQTSTQSPKKYLCLHEVEKKEHNNFFVLWQDHNFISCHVLDTTTKFYGKYVHLSWDCVYVNDIFTFLMWGKWRNGFLCFIISSFFMFPLEYFFECFVEIEIYMRYWFQTGSHVHFMDPVLENFH